MRGKKDKPDAPAHAVRARGWGRKRFSMSVTGTSFEIIDLPELSRRWGIPLTWLHHQTRTAAKDPLPVLRFGRFVRVEWESPQLLTWLARRRTRGK